MKILASVLASLLAMGAAPAVAQSEVFPGEIVAAWFNETQTIPRGWSLRYAGLEGDVHVFKMDIDADENPMSGITSGTAQLQRTMCHDEGLAAFIAGGVKVRVDDRRTSGGSVSERKGSLIDCR